MRVESQIMAGRGFVLRLSIPGHTAREETLFRGRQVGRSRGLFSLYVVSSSVCLLTSAPCLCMYSIGNVARRLK